MSTSLEGQERKKTSTRKQVVGKASTKVLAQGRIQGEVNRWLSTKGKDRVSTKVERVGVPVKD